MLSRSVSKVGLIHSPSGNPMTIVCLSALAAMALTFAGLFLEALAQVRRRFESPTVRRPKLVIVKTVDRRRRNLPRIGVERRGVPTTVEFALAYGEIRRGA